MADAPAFDLRRLLFVSAYQAYLNTLVGNAPPIIRELFEELNDPVPGDLAIEVSTIYMPERDADRLGRLLRIEDRPFDTDEDWAAMVASGEVGASDKRPSRKVWVLSRADGTTYTWDNARFIKVLEELPIGTQRRAAR